MGRRVLFTAGDAAHGYELWITNGTQAGTHLLRDIEPGAEPSSPLDLTRYKGRSTSSPTMACTAASCG